MVETKKIRLLQAFLAFEAVAFAAMAAVHFIGGVSGEPDPRAAIAESVIAVALATGLAVGSRQSRLALKAFMRAQIFALLFTVLGTFFVVINLTPKNWPDLAFHGIILPVLVAGLIVARSSKRG